MSVGAVTFRTLQGHQAATRVRTIYKFAPLIVLQPRPAPVALYVKPFRDLRTIGDRSIAPRSAYFKPGFVGRITTPYGQAAARKVELRALRKLAAKLLFKKTLGVAGELGPTILEMFWKRVVDPVGFPGWGTFPTGFTSNAGTVYPGKVLGTYTANGFDNGPWSTVVHNLIDTSDGTPIGGFRYWGHFHGTTPLPGGRPGDDWPTIAQAHNLTANQTRTTAQARVRYRVHEQTAELATQPWHVRQNIGITIRTDRRDPISITQGLPRPRDRGDKAKPANLFVWGVLKAFANAGGEAKEWTDILAEASGYIKGSMMLPEDLRDTGKETQAKIYWLFVVTGINSLDWDRLAELIVENEIEDLVYGFAGQLSKSAAQSLGMTVGPQTGLVM